MNRSTGATIRHRDEDLVSLHAMQDEAIRAASASVRPDSGGTGIVMVAGGPRCFTNAYVNLTYLRRVLGSKLPIQIWFLGPTEMSPEMKRIIGQFDVELVDAEEVRQQFPVRRLGPWECKVYAILHSRFRHVFLIDADNVPLVDPAVLFHLPQYCDTGAVFWPDNQSHQRDSPVWNLFRVSYRPELEVESGQLLIDKERCWIPLQLAMHFNEWSDIYYRYVYGDKETFHFAWRQLGRAYAMPDERPSIVYCHKETPYGRRRMTAAMEQRDFAGNYIFHHRTGAEWRLFGENPDTIRTELESVCKQAIVELRDQWNGHVLPNPPMRDDLDGRDIVATRRFLYRLVGSEERYIEFEADGHVGLGSSPTVRSWRIERNGTSRCLILEAEDYDSCRLEMDWDGIWRGASLWYERIPVELVPVGQTAT